MQQLKGDMNRGSIVTFAAVAMPVMLICVGLAVDLGIVVVARQQLQAAADSAALAGVSHLQRELDVYGAAVSARRAAEANTALGAAVQLDVDADVEIGGWDAATGTITPFDTSDGVTAIPDGPAAVRVTARRAAGSAGGPVPLLFARMLGRTATNVQASATAELALSQGVRPPVQMVICQDQSGSFEDEFPAARDGNAALVEFMSEAFSDGDEMAYVGFGYQANSSDPQRRYDTWTFHATELRSTEDRADAGQWLTSYVGGVATVPYSDPTHGACWTNLYSGLLRSFLCFAEPSAAEAAWQQFVASLTYSGTRYNIGWWNTTNALTIGGVTKTRQQWLYGKMSVVLDTALAAAESEHVVVLVSDGMPFYHGNSFPDTKSKQLCTYIADQMASRGVRIHTVCLDQSAAPADGGKGSDTTFTSSLVRNGGHAFYTYDASKLENLQVAVGTVEVGKGHLTR